MGQIQERDGDEGRRHYLDGRGIHCGDSIELESTAHALGWIRVRFELDHRRDERGRTIRVPVAYVGLHTSRGGGMTVACFDLPDDVIARWPPTRD